MFHHAVSHNLVSRLLSPVLDAIGQIVFEMGLQLHVCAHSFVCTRPDGFTVAGQKQAQSHQRASFRDCDVGKVLCLRLSVGQMRNVTQHLPPSFVGCTVLAPMTGC